MLIFSLSLVLISSSAISQNLNITFTGTGASALIDSIWVNNLMTNESLRISGFESLILETSAGKENLDIPASILKMFPNPFKNSAKLEFHQSVPGDALIEIHNLAGQTVLKANQYLYPGRHSFEISLNYPGIFFINIINDNIKSSIKAVCIETNESKPLIRHLGISGFEENRLRSGTNKNIKTMRSNSSIALMLMKKHTK